MVQITDRMSPNSEDRSTFKWRLKLTLVKANSSTFIPYQTPCKFDKVKFRQDKKLDHPIQSLCQFEEYIWTIIREIVELN